MQALIGVMLLGIPHGLYSSQTKSWTGHWYGARIWNVNHQRGGKAHGEMVQLQLLRFNYIWRHNKVLGQYSNNLQSQKLTRISSQHQCGDRGITDSLCSLWAQFDSCLLDLSCFHFTNEDSDSRRLWNSLTVIWHQQFSFPFPKVLIPCFFQVSILIPCIFFITMSFIYLYNSQQLFCILYLTPVVHKLGVT